MKLSVGINWDDKLIDALGCIPQVYEVFGSEDMTMFGSGRPSFLLGSVKKEKMSQYIRAVHEKGLKFNYTINAPCLNNMEFNSEVHCKMIEELDRLVDIGIDGVTVTIPYLLEIIKKRFPKLHTKISVIAQVNSVMKARFFEDMGADEIVLDYMINRDFKLLENIRRSVDCKLSLLLNDSCTFGCAYRNYHYNVAGHASQTWHSKEGFCIDYCTLRCSTERLKDPSLFISARWIRPEDLKSYEDIGYEDFKVAGRRMSADWIINATKAYASRKYNGNLSDIIDCALPGKIEGAQPMRVENLASSLESIKVDSLIKLYQIKPKMPYIDNILLNGFIEFFKNDSCSGDCRDCDYCRKYAEKVVEMDNERTYRLLEVYDEVHKDLVESSFFKHKDSCDNYRSELKKSENQTEIIWPERIKQCYDILMSNVPEQFRLIAREASYRSITDMAARRGSNEISADDFANGVIKNVPDIFRNNMITGLKGMGFDLKHLNL